MPLQNENEDDDTLAEELDARVEDMLAGEVADADSVEEAFLSD